MVRPQLQQTLMRREGIGVAESAAQAIDLRAQLKKFLNRRIAQACAQTGGRRCIVLPEESPSSVRAPSESRNEQLAVGAL
jgi:hypothetical protein